MEENVNRLGGLYGNHQMGSVYDSDFVCPTIDTMNGGNRQPMIVEDVKQIGNIVDTGNWDNPQRGRIYSQDGLAPSLNTVGGGGLEPKIIVDDIYNSREPRTYTEYSPSIREEREGLKVVEDIKVLGDYHESNHDASRVVDTNGIAPTVKENHGFNEYREPQTRKDGCANTLSTVQKDNEILKTYNELPRYRIRKLTPKECFRLMGVSDYDADKMLSVNSNSQCYKQAGNSIVVPVLEAMFNNLNIHNKEVG